ncbi:MAG: M28 family peptidase [Bacteroidota bacterium]
MMRIVLFFLSFFFAVTVFAQENILSTNPLAEQILLGNYDPADYQASTLINDPASIAQGIASGILPDSLRAYLFRLSAFRTRNTGADTLSPTEGMGAARNWVFEKFEEFSAQREQRLVTSFLQFDQEVCGMGRHKNIFTVLPGMDKSDPSIIIVQAHIDSRCEGPCDVDCLAEGSEDNGSGTALVIELARVMSQFSFDHTIVFMATTGEEQGLFGATAFAQYAVDNGISIKAVFNNDTVGGIICGETSSPPSCPGLNHWKTNAPAYCLCD